MEKDRFVINVTEDDIEEAMPNNVGHCPVALAIVRTLFEQNETVAKCPRVTTMEIRFSLNGERLVWRTPKAVAARIEALDRGELVDPFSFKLDLSSAQVIERPRAKPDRITRPRNDIYPPRNPGVLLIRNPGAPKVLKDTA